MRMTTIKNAKTQKRIGIVEAESEFIKHCKLKNLREETLRYYEEDIEYFFSTSGTFKYVDEVTQQVYEDWLVSLIDADKKTTSLNTRIRGLRVFFRFMVEREYMKPLEITLMKEDAEEKEPYTDAELARLLKKPDSNRWTEWRMWCAVNYLIATGNRVGTVINLRVKDIDFEKGFIFLRMMKNRKQQLIPLSKALEAVLREYLDTWDWTPDSPLFPSCEGAMLNKRGFQNALTTYNISRGVSKTSAHLFRHTFAKKFVMAGGGMVQLQGWLGHSTIDMSRHYVNLYGNDLQIQFNPLDNLTEKMKKEGA